MSTPAYGIGLIYDQVKCRCETQLAHELSGCKRKKLKSYGRLDRFTKFFFGPTVFGYNTDWEIEGVQYGKRNAELKTVRVQNIEENISLALYAYRFSMPLYIALHQPGHVIRMYIKAEGRANYTNRSIDHFVNEYIASQWNNVMDTLANKEVYTKIIGPLVDNKCWRKPLQYKWQGPLTAEEIREQRRKRGQEEDQHIRMPRRLPSQRVSDVAGVPLEIKRRHQTAPARTTSPKRELVTCTWQSATSSPDAEPEMFQMEL